MSEDARGFFLDRFGLDDRSLDDALGTALERQVDYADLFFEYSIQDSVALEEGIVKSGDRHLEQGVGVRAQIGERQGYAHSDDVTVESLQLAAATARAISEGDGERRSVALSGDATRRDLYPVEQAPTSVPVERKTALLSEIDAYARGRDRRLPSALRLRFSPPGGPRPTCRLRKLPAEAPGGRDPYDHARQYARPAEHLMIERNSLLELFDRRAIEMEDPL